MCPGLYTDVAAISGVSPSVRSPLSRAGPTAAVGAVK